MSRLPVGNRQRGTVRKNRKFSFDVIPLSVRVVCLSILIGGGVFWVSDIFLVRQVQSSFRMQLDTKLDQQTEEGRQRLDSFLKRHFQLAELILEQHSFQVYLQEIRGTWRDDGAIVFHQKKPKWLPSRTILRTFSQAGYYLVLDEHDTVREVYQADGATMPQKLLHPDPFFLKACQNENFITEFAGKLHVVSAQTLATDGLFPAVTILLATPIDGSLLTFLKPPYTANQEVAISTGLTPYILVSSDEKLVPAGQTIAQLKETFLVFEKKVFGYEATDLLVSYVHLLARDEVERLSKPVISQARLQLFLIALVFTFSLALAMIWLSRRIQLLTHDVVGFTHKALGDSSPVIASGDPLTVLKGQFEILLRAVQASTREQSILRSTILKSIPFPLFYQDLDGIILGCNKAFAVLIGSSLQKIKGKYLRDVLDAEICELLMLHHGGNKNPDMHGVYEISMLDQAGEKRNFLVHVASFPKSSENQGGLVAALADITPLRKAEEEKADLEGRLQQAQKMEAIGTLAGGIAHDFNNILTPILGYSEMGRLRLAADHEVQDYLLKISQAGHRAKDMVQQILSFSRREDQELLPVNLVPLVKEVMKLLRGSIPSTIAFELDIAQEDLIVKGDPTQFHQVIMNLCTNSYHAMLEDGGILSLSLQPWQNTDLDSGEDSEWVKLTVTDTGCGMDKELQRHIFEPYFTTKSQGKGSGMGLSVVLGIIQHHGGTISVESEPGHGTTVTVALPRLSKERVVDMDEAGGGDYPIGQERIIVVDDEPMNVMLLENMLQSLGYSVVGFHNSEDALVTMQLDPSRYDLLISDMTMPNVTGEQLARSILKLRPEMPIILCTGHSESLDKKAAKTLGIMDYIAKPLSLKTLAESVRSCLDASKNKGKND